MSTTTHADPAGDPDANRAWRHERALVEALKRGDEAAFAELVDMYHPAMVRLARSLVGTQAVAEEVAQEAWLGALSAVARFEGRSSVKTWLFRILTNIALKRAQRERRSVPFASWGSPDAGETAVDPDRFLGADHQWAGHWATPPSSWAPDPMERLLAREARELIAEAIATLPETQRAVITLRDVEGCSSTEVCESLGVSEVNQRVLLHRARAKVRAALDDYVGVRA